MKNFLPRLSTGLVAAVALFLAGCSQNRVRPVPSSTIVGPQTDRTMLPSDVNVTPDQLGLSARAGVIETEDTIEGLFEAVYFGFDRSSIEAAERPKIQAVKQYLDSNPQYRISVTGYCDWRGTAEYNLALGDRRAAAAKDYLVNLGVPAARIDTVSKGSLEANKNADDEGAKKDRRAVFIVLKK